GGLANGVADADRGRRAVVVCRAGLDAHAAGDTAVVGVGDGIGKTGIADRAEGALHTVSASAHPGSSGVCVGSDAARHIDRTIRIAGATAAAVRLTLLRPGTIRGGKAPVAEIVQATRGPVRAVGAVRALHAAAVHTTGREASAIRCVLATRD